MLGKQILAGALCVTLLLGLVGCGNKTTDNKGGGDMPTYEDNKSVISFADAPPRMTEDRIKEYFDAGFTAMLLTEDSQPLTDKNTGEINKDYLTAATTIAKYGDLIFRNQYNYPYNWQNDKVATIDAYGGIKVDIPVRNITTELTNMENVIGYYQADEPEYKKIETLTPLVDWHNKYAKDKIFHINLFPSYATGLLGENGYEAYLQHYVDTILSGLKTPKTLCLDNYPLQKDSQGKNYIRASYLSDLLTAANIARDYNAKSGEDDKITLGYCIQTFEDTALRDIEAQEDINFQINTCMAMGASFFEYFLYVTIQQMIGMVERGSYEHRPAYDYVKNANAQLAKWDHVILSFDWQGLVTSAGSDESENEVALGMVKSQTLEKLEGVSKLESRLDTLVGQFIDKDGNQGYMVTNYTEPTAGKIDVVRMTFEDAENALVYLNGEESVVKLEDGRLTLTLNSGEGAFVIPY